MTNPGPHDDVRVRREKQQDRDAAEGDGLARATQSQQTGEGLEDDQDTADGEQAER